MNVNLYSKQALDLINPHIQRFRKYNVIIISNLRVGWPAGVSFFSVTGIPRTDVAPGTHSSEQIIDS
jgi:hypothetical protein